MRKISEIDIFLNFLDFYVQYLKKMLIFASLFKSNINVEQIKIRMKKIMMIAAMMVATLSANAQNEVGQFSIQPKAGINISKITGGGMSSRVGFAGGIEAEYGVAKNFGLSAGLLYSMQGGKYDMNDFKTLGITDKFKFNFDYINIPILAQYYIAKGFAVKAGIQLGFVVRDKVKIEEIVAGGGKYNEDMSFDEFLDVLKLTGTVRDDAKLKKFDFSIPVGLSYEYKNIVLDARYNIGTTSLWVTRFPSTNRV